MKRKLIKINIILLSLAFIMPFFHFANKKNDVYSEQSQNMITMFPTVSAFIKDSAQYNLLKTGDTKPDVAILEVDADLNIVLSEGQISLEDVANDLKATEVPAFIPAFYVKDNQAAQAVASYVSQNISDCYVASNVPDLVGIMRKTATKAGGLIDLRDKNKMSVKVIRDTANVNYAKVVLLGKENSDRDKIFSLQKLLVTVWTEALDCKLDVYAALTSGANGITSENYNDVIQSFETYSQTTMFRRPVVIGHRGIPSVTAENTLEGAKLAAESGADVIENDIQLTNDGHLVIMHDPSVARTTDGTGNISDMTLAQIKTLNIDTHGKWYKVPTLAEYFEAFKNTDIVHFVEIKDNNPKLAKALSELIEQYDVSDQVVVISFLVNQLKAFQQLMPQISIGDLNITFVKSNDEYNKIKQAVETLNTYNATMNSPYTEFNKIRVKELNDRGITVWPWTYRDNQIMYKDYFSGYNGLTTDMVQNLNMLDVKVDIPESFDGNINKSFKIDAKVCRQDKYTFDIDAELIYIEGDDLGLTKKSDGYTALNQGTAWYYMSYRYENIVQYYIFSNPIKITIGEEFASKGCSGCAGANMTNIGLLIGWAFVLISLKKRFGL